MSFATGISSSFAAEHNIEFKASPLLPRPPAAQAAPVAPAPVAVPVVLPSAEIAHGVSRSRSRSASKEYTTAQVEYRGVSSMFGHDINVADLNLSPQKSRLASKTDTTQPVPAQPSNAQPVPSVLPSASLVGAKNVAKDPARPLQPLTNWSGVSSQFQDEHNIAMHASPEPVKRPEEPRKAVEPQATAEPDFAYREPTNAAPAAARSRGASRDYSLQPGVRSRGASKDYTSGCMPPVETYAGVAAIIAADEYQVPSPVQPRRGRKGSKEIDEDAYPVEKPVAEPAPEVDEHAAKQEAFVSQAKAEAMRKSHVSNHYGFSPLSSIHS